MKYRCIVYPGGISVSARIDKLVIIIPIMCIPAHYHHQKIFYLVFFPPFYQIKIINSWKIALGLSNEQADVRLDSE